MVCHSVGVKNGKKTGKMSNTVVSVVEKIKHKNVVHWFRNDQRIVDHEILSNRDSCATLRCFYLHPPKTQEVHPLGFPMIGKHRKKFLSESLIELENQLKKISIPFHIVHHISELKELGLLEGDIITLQKLYGTEELTLERAVSSAFKGQPLSFDNYSLANAEHLPFSITSIPAVFSSFRKKVEKYGRFNEPIEIPKLPHTPIPYQQKGGETHALQRLAYYFYETNLLSTYKETRNGMVGTDFSSRLSPWLANGNISARSVYHFIQDYERKVGANSSTYWLFFELLWRDFFQFQLQKHGSKFFKRGGIQEKEIAYRNNIDVFWKWINGTSGDELVDANMRELQSTGWMSNRGRQNVASYLVHDLNLNWRWGAAWMESQLIDYDPASNWGNWMYIAGVGNDPRPFRKFNTKGQAERYDSNREYRDLWLS